MVLFLCLAPMVVAACAGADDSSDVASPAAAPGHRELGPDDILSVSDQFPVGFEPSTRSGWGDAIASLSLGTVFQISPESEVTTTVWQAAGDLEARGPVAIVPMDEDRLLIVPAAGPLAVLTKQGELDPVPFELSEVPAPAGPDGRPLVARRLTDSGLLVVHYEDGRLRTIDTEDWTEVAVIDVGGPVQFGVDGDAIFTLGGLGALDDDSNRWNGLAVHDGHTGELLRHHTSPEGTVSGQLFGVRDGTAVIELGEPQELTTDLYLVTEQGEFRSLRTGICGGQWACGLGGATTERAVWFVSHNGGEPAEHAEGQAPISLIRVLVDEGERAVVDEWDLTGVVDDTSRVWVVEPFANEEQVLLEADSTNPTSSEAFIAKVSE